MNWRRYEFKATSLDAHYNLNQPAKEVDNSLDRWTLAFHMAVQLRGSDSLYFCGPNATITVQVLDVEAGTVVHEASIAGVPPCVP